jgi:hypothetical protein
MGYSRVLRWYTRTLAGSALVLGDERYELMQIVAHAGSETTVNGQVGGTGPSVPWHRAVRTMAPGRLIPWHRAV